MQLATADALYSDGEKYTPAIAAIKALKKYLPAVNNVLVLGTGLGSIIQVMSAKGYHPYYTLVEMDKTVLGWALELMPADHVQRAEPVCADAQSFMNQNKKKYDFVFIDIFNSRVVPDFVTTPEFLEQCRDSLAPNGCLAFNYIVNDNRKWKKVQEVFGKVFPGYYVVDNEINRILIKEPQTVS